MKSAVKAHIQMLTKSSPKHSFPLRLLLGTHHHKKLYQSKVNFASGPL